MDFKNNIGVQAGAGTGKTTRMIQALLEGLKNEVFSIDEIAVITFAPKVAEVLKTGIIIQLQNALDAGDEWAAWPLKNLSACPIGTIDSFCEHILRERPVEAGIDPDFTVTDETQQEDFFKTVYSNWLNDMLERHYESYREIFMKRNIPLKISGKNDNGISLEYLSRTAVRHRELALFYPQKPEPVQNLLNRFIEECERLKAQTRNGALQKWMNQYIQDIKVGLAATKTIPVIWNFSPGNKGGAAGKELRDQWKAVSWRYTELLNYTINYPEIRRFYEKTDRMIINFRNHYHETLLQQGRLDSEEILYQTEQLLANRLKVREHFKNRFAHLFIDGFEDASPLQIRILFYLAEKKEEAAETWEAVNLEPGKLYVVSDPLQSAGRSQWADMETYSAAMALMTGGASEHPTINYRSSEPLLRQMNRFFKERIKSPAAKNCQPSYIPMAPYQKSKTDGTIICVEPEINSETRQIRNKNAAKETEAQLTAAWILKTVECKQYTYGDFLVLFRHNTNIHRTAAYLETLHIPYRMIEEHSHFRHGEVCYSVSETSEKSAFTSCTVETDVVRLMTIHQAKGLESKIVFIADSTSPNTYANDLFIDNRQGRIIYKLANLETPEYKTWQEADRLRNEAKAEQLRYVAATRAKTILVINKIPFEGSAKTFAAPFYDINRIKTEKIALSDFKFIPGKPEPALQLREASRMKIEWDYNHKTRTYAIAKIAVPSIRIDNALSAFSPSSERHSKVLYPINAPGLPCGLLPRATIGSMTNKLLTNHSADLAASAKTLITDTGSKIGRCVLVKIVSDLKKQALQKRIDNADAVLREIPIKFQHHDGTFYDGIIDLLFKEDDGWVLVDYQAIRINRKSNPNKLNQKYTKRMSLYTKGLRKIGINVKESVLASA